MGKAIASKNGIIPATFLVGSFARGVEDGANPRESEARGRAVRPRAKENRETLSEEGGAAGSLRR